MIKDTIYFMLLAFFTAALKTSCPIAWTYPNAISFAYKLAESTALFGSRLLVIFWLGRLLVRTTRVSELRDALTRLFSHIPLARNYDLGLGLSSILGFVPLVFDEWRLSLEAARTRGFAPSLSMPKWADFMVAFLRRLMVRAVSVPEAISARGWTRVPKASTVRLGPQDFVFIVASLAFTLATALRLV
jgi:energy-coupling factor transporter transmembrane protein EcfT